MNEKIDKIVELDIDDNFFEEEIEGTGVEIVSLVDAPAIQADFLYFNEEEFITPNPCQPGYEAIGTKIKDGREVPNCVPIQNNEQFVEPNAGESEEDFIGRCMKELESEFPDRDQRLAVCYSYYDKFDEQFESYSDYPKAARENACRAVIFADEEGWGSCGTAVGGDRDWETYS